MEVVAMTGDEINRKKLKKFLTSLKGFDKLNKLSKTRQQRTLITEQ